MDEDFPGLASPDSHFAVGSVLSPREKLSWLRLSRSENVGPVTFFKLLERYGTASAALDTVPDLARHGGLRRPIKLYPQAKAEAEIADITAFGGRMVALCEPEYPRALAMIHDPPPVISVKGSLHLLSPNSPAKHGAIAIVGARNASAVGQRFTGNLAAELGKQGFVVVSGLARGIDSAAHAGSLATGTVAVLAGGVDNIYPPENNELHGAICESGLVIAEQPFGTQPQARHFPRRNRLVSGLSRGVVVVEAAKRSGSLITARMALEQNREVFAVPGSPLDPRCGGSNDLLRQGATLVEGVDDIIATFASMPPPSFAEPPSLPIANPAGGHANCKEVGENDRRHVIDKLSPSPVGVDELMRQCQLTAPVMLTILLELELAGRLDRHAGNRVSLL